MKKPAKLMSQDQLDELRAMGASVEPIKRMPVKTAEFDPPVFHPPIPELPPNPVAPGPDAALQGMMEHNSMMMQRLGEELKAALATNAPCDYKIEIERDPKTDLMTCCYLRRIKD